MDPYKILNVSPNATDDEIKKAYKQLSKKYHPDANINNPDKAHAEEMFKNVQQAYQVIMKQRTSGNSYDTYGTYGREQNTYQQEGDSYLRAAISYLQSGYYREARNVLDGMSNRNADWYFYSAQAHLGLGNQMEAMEDAKHAVSMNPNNYNYQVLLNRIQNGNGWYETRSRQYGTPYESGANFCLDLCLLNLACNICC